MRWAWLPMFSGIVVLVVLLISLRPGFRHRHSARWIRDQGAPITPDLRAEVETTRWRQHIGSLIGAAVGLAVAVPLIRRVSFDDDRSLFLSMVALFVPIVLMTVGSNVSSLMSALQDVGGTVRVAQSWAPRMSDFGDRAGLVTVRITTLTLLGAAVAAVRLPSWQGFGFDDDQSGYAWCILVGLVVVWTTSELMTRRLVAQPQPSGDATTLFWRSAIRGERVTEVFMLPASLGLLILTLISLTLPRTRGPADEVMWDLLMGLMVVIPILGIISNQLLNRGPSGPHREAALQAARRAHETV